jgi:hypothetical protein
MCVVASAPGRSFFSCDWILLIAIPYQSAARGVVREVLLYSKEMCGACLGQCTHQTAALLAEKRQTSPATAISSIIILFIYIYI